MTYAELLELCRGMSEAQLAKPVVIMREQGMDHPYVEVCGVFDEKEEQVVLLTNPE